MMIAENLKQYDIVTFEDLKLLAAARGPCATIITHIRTPQELTARIKNATRNITRQLQEQPRDARFIDSFLGPIHDFAGMVESAGLWSNTLVLFRAPNLSRYFLLHGRVTELETVEDRFQIRPLLAALAAEQRFHILGLSRHHVRMFECTQHCIEESDTRRIIPQDMREWLHNRQPDHVLDNRSTAGPSVGSMKGVTFGTSTDRERETEYLTHFLKEVNKGVNIILRGDDAPLLLAGVETELAAYRRVNTYPRLDERAVEGSPDGLSNQDLHRRAMDAVMQSQSAQLKSALAELEKYRNLGRVSSDIREVCQRAREGRVAEFFIAESAEFRGTTNPPEDLLNTAALQTLLHGGRAFSLKSQDMPDNQDVAAAFRF